MIGSFFRKRRRSADELGKFLAEAYRGAFAADKFHGLFDTASLAPDQNVDVALAEWHAFGAFVFTYCLWVVYDDQDKVFSVLDSFQPDLLRSFFLNEACEKRFLEIASDREKDYVVRFRRAKEGRDLECFFSRATARITGQFSSELDLQGIPQPTDIALTLPLTDYTMAVLGETKSAIEKFGPK